MRGLLLALLLLGAVPAVGQDFPATFRVAGVAAGDALNLRAAPSGGAAVLATLAPDARGVEVLGLSPDGLWARVPLPEGEGWAARRFLAPEPAARGVPRPLRCLGTEPFWALTLDAEGGAAFERAGEAPLPLRLLGEAAGRTGFVAAFDAGGGTRDLAVVRRACSDGMSDRPYGLAALSWNRGEELLEGCCTLDAR